MDSHKFYKTAMSQIYGEPFFPSNKKKKGLSFFFKILIKFWQKK